MKNFSFCLLAVVAAVALCLCFAPPLQAGPWGLFAPHEPCAGGQCCALPRVTLAPLPKIPPPPVVQAAASCAAPTALRVPKLFPQRRFHLLPRRR